MATMSGDKARSLRAKFKAFDAACAAAQSPPSTATRDFLIGGAADPAPPGKAEPSHASVLRSLDPTAMQKFYAAVRGAWQLILALEPSTTGRRQDVIDAIAVGVLRAASEGERDTGRLSAEACWYFIAGRKSAHTSQTADRAH